MKKVIITGASGFIGGALARSLLRDGVTVVAVGRNLADLEPLKAFGTVIPIRADLCEYDHLAELLGEAGQDVDVFYHFAWDGVFGEAFQDYSRQLNNARYACDALLAAVDVGCKKFVLAGTYNQYEIATRAIGQYDAPRYTCIYAAAKTAADMMCRTLANAQKIDYCAGLVCMAYGEGNRSRMLANIVIDQLRKGIRPKLVEADGPYDMIYIEDVAGAFRAIGERGINQRTYYVGHRQESSFGQLIGKMRDVLAPGMKLIFGEYQETTRLDYSLIDREALYRDTGFECEADFGASILRTAKWLNAQEEK